MCTASESIVTRVESKAFDRVGVRPKACNSYMMLHSG